jgi:tetratricopeptide (TPR) repeat protein
MSTVALTLPEAFGRATQAFERRDWIEAERWCGAILGASPDEIDAIFLRALVQHRRGRRLAALASYERVLDLRPDHVGALNNRGVAFAGLERFTEALASYDAALAIEPDDAETLNNRGIALKELGRLAEALASYDRALAIQSDFVDALNNRGNVLHALGRSAEALTTFDRLLKIAPERPDVLNYRGVVLQALGRLDEALASYHKAQAMCPDDPDAHWNEALLHLSTGDYVPGWRKHEWRWQRETMKAARRDLPQPLWDGVAPLAGKTVLLHSEQGLGDTIQFCRYVPMVAARGAHVILAVQDPLRSLMGSLAGVSQFLSPGEPLPAFDLHCPLMSLPLAFDTTVDTIPAAIPYLHPSADACAVWESRLQGRRPGQHLRVGMAWSGNPSHTNDRNRSMTLEALLPLLDVDATFVSLQKEVPPDDATLLASRDDILQVGGMLRDFADTAALVMNLDLVVTVDSSMAHLAGALGKPVWVLLPVPSDWRWLRDRETSPWYPTARLFRQSRPGDWGGVATRAKHELRELAGGDRSALTATARTSSAR